MDAALQAHSRALQLYTDSGSLYAFPECIVVRTQDDLERAVRQEN